MSGKPGSALTQDPRSDKPHRTNISTLLFRNFDNILVAKSTLCCGFLKKIDKASDISY